jgi:DNA-binding IclR family transcriptional regulator
MDDRYNIQVLERAFRVMDALLAARAPLGLEELVQHTQLPKSTTFRIITNLVRHGYLCETNEGYWLGLKMLSFGTAVEERLDVRAVSAPFLERLRDETNETVYLATLTDDWLVMYLDKYVSRQPVGVYLHSAGMTIEMYCTGLGKCLAAHRPEADVRKWLQTHEMPPRTPTTITNPDDFLAELDAIRQRGYSIDNGERSTGIRCVAAPLYNAHGAVIAAISVAGPAERMPGSLISADLGLLIRDTARQISAALGASMPATNGHYRETR